MNFFAVASVLCICLSTSFATYGPEYKNHGPKNHYDGHRLKLDEPRIHLNSPKIILDRPSINVHGNSHGPLHDDESIFLGSGKPLYISKSLHGISAGPAHYAASHPVILNGGYSSGKVLDIEAPIQVINHAPIVQERPVLIRRPVVVSKGLTSTQDHLEQQHYAHSGLAHASLLGGIHGGYAVPISKGLHERTVVYSDVLGHGGYGHGLNVIPSYHSAPLFLAEQPRTLVAHSDIGYASGKALHGHVLQHGGVLHGTGFHGNEGHLHASNGKKY